MSEHPTITSKEMPWGENWFIEDCELPFSTENDATNARLYGSLQFVLGGAEAAKTALETLKEKADDEAN